MVVVCAAGFAAVAVLMGCAPSSPEAAGKSSRTGSAVLSQAVNRAEDVVSRARGLLGLGGGEETVPPAPAGTAPRHAPAARVAMRRAHAEPVQIAAPVLASGQLPALTAIPSLDRPPEMTWDDGHTYSSADEDVLPPIVSDALLASLRTYGIPGTRNAIELQVNADGVVDGVRLLSPPHQLADIMVLAAAKAWRLEPAARDGRPVSYRLVLSWIAAR